MSKGLKVIVNATLCLLISFGVACIRGLFSSTSVSDVFRFLCDGFFITGTFITCMGCLSWISSTGQFDSFSYAKHVIVSKFNTKKEVEKYYDFKQKKEKERGTKKWNKGFVIYGCVLIVLSFVFLFVYTKSEL